MVNRFAKDFDKWNEKKKEIHSSEMSRKYYHEREIWWCSLGVNVGYEHDGTGATYQRPVLILRGLSAETCLAIPLTSSPNRHPFRMPIGLVDGKDASAVISQIRVIDTKRLTEKICYLDEDIFARIRKAAKDLL
jgi:mRNA-degrading endonuclease toxin of MazEF toxin-antitoxin module